MLRLTGNKPLVEPQEDEDCKEPALFRASEHPLRRLHPDGPASRTPRRRGIVDCL